MQHWNSYTEMVIALFVVVDPIAAIPIFISLTDGYNARHKAQTAALTALAVAVTLIATAFVGESLLRVFGVSVDSFRVGGGILILLMAIAMLQARPSRTQHTPQEIREAENKNDVAVVPLGIPLLAGPGAMSTVIIYTQGAKSWIDNGFVLIAVVLVAVSVWLALRLADPIRHVLGKTGINVLVRLFGLILAAVAVEFIAGGVAQLFPALGTATG